MAEKKKKRRPQVKVEDLKENYTEEEIRKMMRTLVETKKYEPGTQGNDKGGIPPTVLDREANDTGAPLRKEIMGQLMRWYRLPPCESDEELEDRLTIFFEECFETGEYITVEKLALAIGTTSQTMTRWVKGEIYVSPKRVYLVKKAYELIHAIEGQLATQNSINPIVYMFRSKNYFDMKNENETVVRIEDPLGPKRSEQEIEEMYESTIIDADFREID